MKNLWVLGAVALAPSAWAEPDPTRVAEIWGYAQSRIEQQNDAWFDDGEFPMVIQALRMQIEIVPEDYEVSTNLGWMLENVQNYDAAQSVYERFLKDNPNDPDGALPLAQFYFLRRKDQLDKIPPLLDKVVLRDPPPHPNAFRILAHSYERIGKIKESRDVWALLISKNPSDEAAKANLRRVEAKLNKG